MLYLIYRVSANSKLILQLLLLLAVIVLFAVTEYRVLLILYPVAGIWLYMYLSGIALKTEHNRLIKYSGNLLKRKTIFMLENVNTVTVYKLKYSLPSILKLSYRNKDFYILGFTAGQLEQLEKIIERN